MSKRYKIIILPRYCSIPLYRASLNQAEPIESRDLPASNQEIASTAWTYVTPRSERNEQQMYKNERKQSPIISINRLFVRFYRFISLLSVYRFSVIAISESPWKQHPWSSDCSSLFKEGMRSSSTTGDWNLQDWKMTD